MNDTFHLPIFRKCVTIAPILLGAAVCLHGVIDLPLLMAQPAANDSAVSRMAAGLWMDTLPQPVQASILWQADHEEGDLTDWEPTDCKYPGGGILNTGGDAVIARATTAQAHSGRYAAEATITGARRGRGGNRAVRLMRWTDRPWDQGGVPFPPSAYYSSWMLIPELYNTKKYPPWDPGDGGWWNVFQFKADDEHGESQPMWALNIYYDDDTRTMKFGLYSPVNRPASVDPPHPVSLPVGQWFHVEAFYRVDDGRGGEIAIWQDGMRIMRATGVRTVMTPNNAHAVWGVGNYTDHIAGPAGEGTGTVYFDDCLVSTKRISATFARRASLHQDRRRDPNADD